MPDTPAKAAWDKEHTTFIGLKLNDKRDADIIAALKSQPSMQGYIKSLIRKDISNSRSE